MKICKNGIMIEVDQEFICDIYIMPKTARGSLQFSSCNLEPGFHKISSIDMNELKFSISGKWFYMEDFDFSDPT